VNRCHGMACQCDPCCMNRRVADELVLEERRAAMTVDPPRGVEDLADNDELAEFREMEAAYEEYRCPD